MLRTLSGEVLVVGGSVMYVKRKRLCYGFKARVIAGVLLVLLLSPAVSSEAALAQEPANSGTSVLQYLYATWSEAPVRVDLVDLWKQLG
jgi:hypothetical protein